MFQKSSKELHRQLPFWGNPYVCVYNYDTNIFIQTLLDSAVIPTILDIMNTAEYKIRKEAVWAVCNAISGGTPDQIRFA